MTTSGQTAQVTLSWDRLLNMAVRRCKKSTSDITPEIAESAADNLYLFFSSLANYGVTLWTMQRRLLGVYPYQRYVDLPAGTVDVRNAAYRSMTFQSDGTPASSSGGTAANAFDQDAATACTQTAINGNLSYDFVDEVVITTVGVMANGNRTYSLVVEASADGSTWVNIKTLTAALSYADKTWRWFDLDATGSYQYWRVRETAGGTLNVFEVSFCRNQSELPLGVMNQDDYTNLPDKTMPSGSNENSITQFWMDRQITPRMWLWPVPVSTFGLISVMAWSQPEDPGSLTNELAVPTRWLECVVANLAKSLAMEIPDVPEPIVARLIVQANEQLKIARAEERTRAPIFVAPDISPYTR